MLDQRGHVTGKGFFRVRLGASQARPSPVTRHAVTQEDDRGLSAVVSTPRTPAEWSIPNANHAELITAHAAATIFSLIMTGSNARREFGSAATNSIGWPKFAGYAVIISVIMRPITGLAFVGRREANCVRGIAIRKCCEVFQCDDVRPWTIHECPSDCESRDCD